LRATFILPKVDNFEITKDFTIFALKFIEKVAGYTISTKLQGELDTMRAEFESKRESNKNKNEEASEKSKRLKEEKWAKMTPMER
jgi:hypothetical protein